MRIIAGKYRGLVLASVGKGDVGAHLRPTTDRVRESIFSTLAGGRFDDPLSGARVLDLFAGTGALGLEALSRGAAHAVFIDDGRKAQALLRENISRCRASGESELLNRDATKLGRCPCEPFTLVFLDPPYGKGLGERALGSAIAGGWIAPGATIVWEDNTAVRPPIGVEKLEMRRYGDTIITYLKKAAG